MTATGFWDQGTSSWTVGSTYQCEFEIGSGYGLTLNAVLLDANLSAAVDQAAGIELSFATNGAFNTTLA